MWLDQVQLLSAALTMMSLSLVVCSAALTQLGTRLIVDNYGFPSSTEGAIKAVTEPGRVLPLLQLLTAAATAQDLLVTSWQCSNHTFP